jgi:hypothetical protein
VYPSVLIECSWTYAVTWLRLVCNEKSLCTSLECLGVDGLAQNLGSTFA